jgi:hypothetical protein
MLIVPGSFPGVCQHSIHSCRILRLKHVLTWWVQRCDVRQIFKTQEDLTDYQDEAH